MKKTVYLLIIIFAINSVAYGQKMPLSGKHSIKLSLGIAPMVVASDNGLSCAERNTNADMTFYYLGNKVYSPSANITYSYQLRKWLSISSTLTYANVNQKTYNIHNDNIVERWTKNYIGLTPFVQFDWLRKSYVRLYSSVGVSLGVELNHYVTPKVTNKNYLMVNPDFTIIGISAGRRWFGFSELAASPNGIVRIGVGYRFKDKNK